MRWAYDYERLGGGCDLERLNTSEESQRAEGSEANVDELMTSEVFGGLTIEDGLMW
jgi:hypothetical protein